MNPNACKQIVMFVRQGKHSGKFGASHGNTQRVADLRGFHAIKQNINVFSQIGKVKVAMGIDKH
jgi:hypothetical protein